MAATTHLPCAVGSAVVRRGVEVPLDDALAWATLRRGRFVQLLGEPAYCEAVCLWPYPGRGFVVFPMTLLQATALQATHPDFGPDGPGVTGKWRLRRAGERLETTLVHEAPLREFWAAVTAPGFNPAWLEPCFAAYRGVPWDDLPALAPALAPAEE